MSMILDLASAARGAFDHLDTTQAVDVLARGGSRRSTHFFFFGGGAGMLLWIPILGLAFLYHFVKRNPDKARMYKDRLKENFAGASSGGARPPAAPTAPGPASAALTPGALGRPPRLRLPTGAGTHPPAAPAPPAPAAPDRPWTQHAGAPRVQPRPTASAPHAAAAPEGGAVKSATATWSFTPPPQWPLRPGFTPGPGWTPDPSWPPAPRGWRFWTQNR
ncbi:hypothetical protein [Mycobacterium sp. PSTR-4-N]|uniref:hypothetical protein n=1 Tax=Mycobacterium sp. PSTR-4-N TaxID=2917745 RepID=UPI001F1537DB|nr:hypothetical protein [Mycobacterium sp. PSTR-4-N]MCG7592743.1 hypothetical protein [Mycobacterium sp. PSTR-4-N]